MARCLRRSRVPSARWSNVVSFLQAIRGKLVVSCQAQLGEPLHGSEHMVAMARAAQQAGAGGIRAESPSDVRAIQAATGLPLLGLWKQDEHGQSFARITPTYEAVVAIARAGADAIALEASDRPRPDRKDLATICQLARAELGKPLVADIATLEEGLAAAQAGVQAVATTLSGYTSQTAPRTSPDFDLLSALVAAAGVPVILEGHVWEPEQVAEGFRRGAHAVVVGSAITRPQLIARRFVDAIPTELKRV
ncbi:MAG: N-acetylmannosamine-6-phosphate 2-epimerase [Cyanobacteria bacterium REEB65]|nr:N-acetylmannosamine-6-phosphate 2-epimerase [Cyanobacteria bacterium REEB65]